MWRSESHHQFAEPTSKPATLADRLQEITARVEQLLPREKRAANERAVRQLEESGIAERILPVGAKAPEFELPNAKSKVVRSADLLAKGKLVIVFYRGRWCPYCVAQLEFLNEIYREIRAAGAELVAISPQTPKQTEFTADQHKLKFPVLSDAGNRAAREFGLVYRIPDYLEEQYRRTFINLPHINGDQSWELPLPATYVVAPDGTVLYGKADADYRKRAEPGTWMELYLGELESGEQHHRKK
jgi:peroxiredoxin